MRYFCIFFLFLSTQVMVVAQPATPATLTEADIREIRGEAQEIIKTHLSDLLNTVTYKNAGRKDKEKLILDSYMESTSQIFFNSTAKIEDDIEPANTIKKSGPDRPINVYLSNLMLFYQSLNNSIRIDEVSVGEVEQKGYPFVKVTFRIHFQELNKLNGAKYQPVYRVAEMRAAKLDKDWIVLITGIRYFQRPVLTQPVVAAATPQTSVLPATFPPKPVETKIEAQQKPAVAPAKPELATKPKDPTANKPPVSQNPIPDKIAQTTPAVPEKTPSKISTPAKVDGPVKTETPIAIAEEPPKTQTPISPPKTEPKKEEAAVVKPSDKSPQITPKVPEPNKQPVAASNTIIAGLEKRAAKYRTQTALYRVASIACIGGAAATVFILKGSYGKYKTQITDNNAKLETWWSTPDRNGTLNGQNFGPLEDYKAKTKSFIGYGTPGLYLAGAGVIAGGILWIMGGKSNQEAKRYQKQADQKKSRISITPQWDGSQKYTGVQLSYQF